MGKEIKALYTKAGLTPPKGKGIHTKEFHECAVDYLKKGMSKDEAYKRCMGGLGADVAVNPSHRRHTEAKPSKQEQRLKGVKF